MKSTLIEEDQGKVQGGEEQQIHCKTYTGGVWQ